MKKGHEVKTLHKTPVFQKNRPLRSNSMSTATSRLPRRLVLAVGAWAHWTVVWVFGLRLMIPSKVQRVGVTTPNRRVLVLNPVLARQTLTNLRLGLDLPKEKKWRISRY